MLPRKKRLTVSFMRDKKQKACPKRAGFLFEKFENSVTDGGADYIEDQIVNVTGAKEGKKLGQLHSGDDQNGSKDGSPEFLKGRENPGQEKSQGNEHDHITAQVDNGGGSVTLSS